MAAMKYTQPDATFVHLRLILSARYPDSSAPKMAPSSRTETIHSCAVLSACRSFLMNSSAPEMTPVS
jgi:hypothetical protein